MNYIEKARQVIDLEMSEVQRLRDRLDERFSDVISRVMETLNAKRKLIVCGVGKSGNIGRKLAATLNSTGATAYPLNAQDALHGDLGAVDEGDLAILLSYSGETAELLALLPHLRRLGCGIIAITGGADSTLARHADLTLDTHVTREACPLNLAPTSSTTAMLVLCDALAMVLLEARGIGQDDFAKLHPGGSLGRVLLTRVRDLMRKGDELAVIQPHTAIRDALQAMTRVRSGAAIVVDDSGHLAGVFTHGDFVRAFQKDQAIADKPVDGFMTRKPFSIHADKLAAEVLSALQHVRVDDVVVVDDENRAIGLVDTQDLTRLRVV
ncbi:MAG: KpsF/GutQ family sugar-phosphate isomerase [Verrucomicrobiaceae bacterium]|nr:KpsF/GutQ family sugar-phosphate isomerase [Verrucomicrobiaceae bacterium]